MNKKCIIIGAGECQVTTIGLQDGDLCIAADGGVACCEMLGIEPDVIIGDFDSVSPKEYEKIQKMEKEKPQCIRRLPMEKDDTDMLAAIRLGLQEGYKKFHLYGALGGKRFEHSFANIQCLRFLKNKGAEGYILDAHRMITVLQNESMTFPADRNGYVSVFALSDKAEGVCIRNMKYEIENAVITNDFPVGVSNELIGKNAEISVISGALLVVFTEKTSRE